MSQIRLGVCCSKEQLPLARQLGYDYGELGLAWLEGISEEEFYSIPPLLSEDFRVEAVNGLLPGSRLMLSDQSYDPRALGAYLDKALGRAEQLGVKVAVFGSGAARSFTPGYPQEKALEQILEFARLLAQKAEAHGIRGVMEPLNHLECSNFHTLREGCAFARQVDRPGFGVLADFYHMAVEQEPLSHVEEAAGLLWHCHISSPGRRALSQEDRGFCRNIAAALKAAGYRGRVSLEAGIADFPAEAGESLRLMRECFCPRQPAGGTI